MMGFTQTEMDALVGDVTKRIDGDIRWFQDEDRSPCVEFRVEVGSDSGYPLFIKGSHNPKIKATSYSLIHRAHGRIYGLCLGKDHHNPDCHNVGIKHKHYWTERDKDKHAYVPDDITATAVEAIYAWEQFCVEANIKHHGTMEPIPPAQEELFL